MEDGGEVEAILAAESRLNLTYRTPWGQARGTTMVVDFVNAPEQIQADFQPYNPCAFLETATDPNLVHDTAARLDAAGNYDESDIDNVVDAWVLCKGHQALDTVLAPTVARFHSRRANALVADDKAELNRNPQDDLDLSGLSLVAVGQPDKGKADLGLGVREASKA